jgi:hypothetical protein
MPDETGLIFKFSLNTDFLTFASPNQGFIKIKNLYGKYFRYQPRPHYKT